MKKNDILILSSTAAYSYLFYNESAGINYLLFTILLATLLIVKDKSYLLNKAWIATAAGSLFSSIAVLIYGSTLAVYSNIFSLLLLTNYSFNKNSSLLFAALHSIYSFLAAIPLLFINKSKSNSVTDVEQQNIGSKILIYLIPILITLVFLLIYRNANPVFKNYTDQLNLDFISWSWIRFVLLGWVLLYAFFNQTEISRLAATDAEGNDALSQNQYNSTSLERSNYELKSGVILFVLLNMLLLLMNIIDIGTLWGSSSLPEGLTYADFVHQGVGSLIISILLAISIILFYFRGALNFESKNKALKILAYVWIIQNIFLLITTGTKNQLYIEEYSLTYKRIGVAVYLVLTGIGLALTFIKILQTKSNWFLFRKNAWAFYAVLIISCFVNWDLFITKFNIQHSKNLDKRYLLRLSSSTLPDLVNLPEEIKDSSEANYYHLDFRKSLNNSLVEYILEDKTTSWQSWNLELKRINEELASPKTNEKIQELDLSDKEINSLVPFSFLSNIHTLNLKNTNLKNLDELKLFPSITNLDLSFIELSNLDSIPLLPSLTSLNLSNNPIQELNQFKIYPNLQTLFLYDFHINNIEFILKQPNLEYLYCKSISKENYESLRLAKPNLKITINHFYDSELDLVTPLTNQ